jgi:hypothetical protein
MSEYLKKFEFSQDPNSIKYLEEEPLALNNELNFFHNKNKFRKELNRLQYLFQRYTGTPLLASGIRDSYLSGELSNEFMIVLFTDNNTITGATKIISDNRNVELKPGCFLLESTSSYMLLLTKDNEGLVAGIDMMESIFKQVFEDYLKKQNKEDFVKIRPFIALDCKK